MNDKDGNQVQLVTFHDSDGLTAGIADGDQIASLADLGRGRISIKELLTAGPAAVAEALEARREYAGPTTAVDAVRLAPPVPDPDKIICLGLNYPSHVAETKKEPPKIPMLFAKYGTSLVGAHDEVVIPRIAKLIDWEGELAVVIGREAHQVTEAEALDHVAGYSVVNDVTARDLQRATSQFMAGKAIDTFAPIGPGIVPAGEIEDPEVLRLRTRVNGAVVQDDSTGSMLIGIAATIAFLSEIITLVPGDIIATGTPSGVGAAMQPPVFLKAGDRVEVEIEGIGSISNPVVGP